MRNLSGEAYVDEVDYMIFMIFIYLLYKFNIKYTILMDCLSFQKRREERREEKRSEMSFGKERIININI